MFAKATSPDTLAPATELAVAANATSPETLAPATALAVAALDTSPETLAPATELAVAANATSPVTFAPFSADNPDPLPVKIPVFAVIFGAVMLPLASNEVSVPTDVILGCAAVYTVPATNAFPTCPDTLEPATAFAVVANATSPDTLPPATEFATAANPTCPVTLAPVSDVILLPSPFKYCPCTTPTFAYKLPVVVDDVTVKPVRVPTLVILGCAAVIKEPPNVLPCTLPELA